MSEALSDYPRLIRVLEGSRHYDLVSDQEISEAKLEIQREIEPQITELISRVESSLTDLQGKERSMHAKVSRRVQLCSLARKI